MTHTIQIDNQTREATKIEAAAIDATHAQSEALAVAAQNKAAARASALAKLSALGLTDDEISALVG